MSLQPLPAHVRVFDVEGQLVMCVVADDGTRTWLCERAKFKERAADYGEGFCGHTVVATMRCFDDGSIEAR